MKLSLPVSHGLPFDSRDEIQEYLATQGLETASRRRRQGLMGQWALIAYDAAGRSYRLEVMEDQGQLWLFGLPD